MIKNNSLNGGKMLKRSVSPDSPFTGISGKRNIYLAVTIAALLLISGMAQADILMVPSQYPTIQDGLNAASEGDTVLVAHGTYYENLIWPGTDSIHLISEAGASQTIIDGSGTGKVIEITTGVGLNTEIRGFTIQHASIYYFGSGIHCVECINSSITITENIITNNFNGIYCDQCSPTITENIITYNYRGIYCDQCSPIITDNIITYNTNENDYGGGICCISANPLIYNNQITNNQAFGGGGIAAFYSSPIIKCNIISENTTEYAQFVQGGCIDCDCSPSSIIIGNTISHNYFSDDGGAAICCDVSPSIIQFNDILYNTSGSQLVVGISCRESSGMSINFNNIADNDYGVWNYNSGDSLNAENNWWGDSSGPGGAGPGTGNGVSLHVDYIPWLIESAPPLPVVSPDITYGLPGETVSIPIMVTELITELGIVSSEFDLTYNSDILTGIDVDPSGTLISGTDWSCAYTVVGDTFSVAMAGTDTLAGIGTLINLIFDVSPAAQLGEESTLHFVNFIFNQGNPYVDTQDGIFIVREAFGAIEGTVTDAETGNPISSAVVTAQGTHTYCDTTDDTGYYFIPEVIPGTYDMTVTAFGYNQFDVTGIIVLPGETTEVNFALLHPEIAVVPNTFDVTLFIDSTLDTLLYITNNGNGPLEFNIEILNEGRKPARDRYKSYSGPTSFCRKPDDWIPDSSGSRYEGEIIESHPSVGSPSGFEWDGTYFWQGNWDNYVVKLDSNFNFVAGYIACGNPDMAPTGLAWHNGYLYQGCYLENRIYKIDVSDGYNPVDIIYTPCTGGLLGVEWVGEHLWVTDDCGEYPGLIYECDSLGNMINTWPSPDTVPFGLAYNPYLDIIYLNGWSGGDIYTIDPYTGEINFAFPTPGSGGHHSCNGSSFDNRYPSYLWIAHQNDEMLYLTDTGYEWISVTPTSGTVYADNTFDVTIHFDTNCLFEPTYTATIAIHNNSIDSLVTIPVTLNVITPYGNVDGTVTDSNTGEPIEGAIVSIENTPNSDITGPDGTYLIENILVGIYDITCTAEGYSDTTDVVEVLEDQTVTVDFVLQEIILNSPRDLVASEDNPDGILVSWLSPAGTDVFPEGFESGDIPNGWLAIDNDGDGYNWWVWNNFVHSGLYSACSFSYINPPGPGAIFPDNYLITPLVGLGTSSELTFWVGASDPAWFWEHFKVKLSTTGTSPSDFTEELLDYTLTSDLWTELSIDLSPYSGQTVYIAWVHCDITDVFNLSLDDISLTNTRDIVFKADFESPADIKKFKKVSVYKPVVDPPLTDKNLPFRVEGSMSEDEINNKLADYKKLHPDTASRSNNRDFLYLYNLYRSDTSGGPYIIVDSLITQTSYLDTNVALNEIWYYVATALYDTEEPYEESPYSNEDSGELYSIGIEEIPVLSTRLYPNSPNPFSHSTTISFSCHRDTENAEIIIYNIKGQKVKTLVNEKLNAGAHQIIWNGKDESGNPVRSGIYFYKFETTDKTFIKKMLLLR